MPRQSCYHNVIELANHKAIMACTESEYNYFRSVVHPQNRDRNVLVRPLLSPTPSILVQWSPILRHSYRVLQNVCNKLQVFSVDCSIVWCTTMNGGIHGHYPTVSKTSPLQRFCKTLYLHFFMDNQPESICTGSMRVACPSRCFVAQ